MMQVVCSFTLFGGIRAVEPAKKVASVAERQVTERATELKTRKPLLLDQGAFTKALLRQALALPEKCFRRIQVSENWRRTGGHCIKS